MELAALDEEKQAYSFMERLLFFVVPFIFVAVLIVVLLTLLDLDFRNKAIQLGQSIPIVKNLLPEESPYSTDTDSSVRTEKLSSKIVELESQLAALNAELSTVTSLKASQDNEIDQLKTENDKLKLIEAETTVDDEQYRAKIQELASMFAKMMPSKAAPIVQSMTLDETALIFSEMRADDQVRIMEKMNPKIAAEVTLKLKDSVSAKDMQIAALQARIDELTSSAAEGSSTTTVSDNDLAASFASMDAGAAADMLLKLMEVSPSKVLRILNVTSNNARSSILAEMSDRNEATTARIVSRLMAD